MTETVTTIELDSITPFGGASPQRFSHETLSVAEQDGPYSTSEDANGAYLSKRSAVLAIMQITIVTSLASLTTGLITISIAKMSSDLMMDPSLAYWPVLVYSLTSGSLLLVSGSLAAVLGNRLINLTGVFFLAVFCLAIGFARNGVELIAFRTLGGIALAMFIPTSIGTVSNNVPSGRMRNIGFSLVGLSQTIGYGIGLVLGGVFIDTISWRTGYYICGSLLASFFLLGIWILPPDSPKNAVGHTMKRLKNEIDWLGVSMAAAGLGLVAFVLGEISTQTSAIQKPYVITMLVFGVLLLAACPLWWHRQERLQRPALIPNRLWKSLPFSAVCIMVSLSYAEMQTMELLTSLFFQDVQHLPAIQASIRLLPSLIAGGVLTFSTGLFVDRIPPLWLVPITTLVSAGAPLLMALIKPEWPYWHDAFIAQLLYPLGVDILFPVALLMVSETFPEKDQALAGAVFSTFGQFGQSLGLAIIAVITNSVSDAQDQYKPTSPKGLLEGYRAGYWTAFGWMILVAIAGVVGFRKAGKVGLKRD